MGAKMAGGSVDGEYECSAAVDKLSLTVGDNVVGAERGCMGTTSSVYPWIIK